jgi:hypothetical protein
MSSDSGISGGAVFKKFCYLIKECSLKTSRKYDDTNIIF